MLHPIGGGVAFLPKGVAIKKCQFHQTFSVSAHLGAARKRKESGGLGAKNSRKPDEVCLINRRIFQIGIAVWTDETSSKRQ